MAPGRVRPTGGGRLPRPVAPLWQPGYARRAGRIRHPVSLGEVGRGRREIARGDARLLDDLVRRHGEGSVEDFLDGYAALVPFLQETARQLLRRWLELSGAVSVAASARLWASPVPRREPLIGREDEQKRIERLLAETRDGRSDALVVSGAAGLGKTALLEWAIEHSNGMQVLRAVGVETAAELPFAGLKGLCAYLLERLDLPRSPHNEALAVALDLQQPTSSGDRFTVYSAFFELLAEAATEAPLLVVVDDVQWVDEATREALEFVVRRGGPAGTALLFAAEGDAFAVSGADCLALRPLDAASMQALFDRRAPVSLAQTVAARVLEVAAGNPLTLLELPLALTSQQRLGLESAEGILHDRATAEEAFVHRLTRLPGPARGAVLSQAWTRKQRSRPCSRPVASSGSAHLRSAKLRKPACSSVTETSVVFLHPLVRSAAVYEAPLARRRAAHAALARAQGGAWDADRRAWHQARAAAAPQEAVAADLAETARRARDRRAHSAAARAFELAARLTPDPQERARRLFDAAEAAYLAGHVSAALDHLDAARADVAAGGLRTEIEHLRGRVTARMGSAAAAREILVAAADRCEGEDARQRGTPPRRRGDPSTAQRAAG